MRNSELYELLWLTYGDQFVGYSCRYSSRYSFFVTHEQMTKEGKVSRDRRQSLVTYEKLLARGAREWHSPIDAVEPLRMRDLISAEANRMLAAVRVTTRLASTPTPLPIMIVA